MIRMQLDLDISGRRIVVFGRWPRVRRVVARYRAAEARLTVVVEGALPATADRPDWVRILSLPDAADRAELLKIIGPAWMVVTVGLESEHRSAIRTLCRDLRLLCTDETPAEETGTITLVGGGPGSLELLTVGACRALREADVVFYDRLAPTADLARLAPAAELVDVGKSPYHHPTPQHRICDLLIERARAGQSVVRLKGGDSFVFGRGGEEMLACAAAGFAVSVVPGVSSAIAVPATAGIPLTHRGASHAFTVISGHVPPSADELAGLVRLGGTVVILMGIANLTQICQGFAAAGMPAQMPAAVVERGFSPSQRTTVTTMGLLAGECRRLGVESPAVVVVGEVARLGTNVAAALELAAGQQVGSA